MFFNFVNRCIQLKSHGLEVINIISGLAQSRWGKWMKLNIKIEKNWRNEIKTYEINPNPIPERANKREIKKELLVLSSNKMRITI